MDDHKIVSTTISILSRFLDPDPTVSIPSRLILKGKDPKVILSEENNLEVIIIFSKGYNSEVIF